MNIYKVKNHMTGQDFEFRSIPAIVEKFSSVKGITNSNLNYHFSRDKKTEVYIKGLFIKKIVID